MRWSDIQFDPPRKTLRQFAGLWLVIFGGMALWQGLVRERAGLASILAVLALTIGPLGLARPDWMRRIYVGWMILAFPIGWTVSQVMLAVIFFGLFTPIGFFFRLLGATRFTVLADLNWNRTGYRNRHRPTCVVTSSSFRRPHATFTIQR